MQIDELRSERLISSKRYCATPLSGSENQNRLNTDWQEFGLAG